MRPIRGDPVKTLTQICDHPPPDPPARHPAPRPPRHERRAGVRRPAHQPLQLLHAAGQRHARRHHAINPGALGVRGPDPRVRDEAGEGGSGKGHGAHGGKYMRALSLTRLHPRVMLEGRMPADAPRAQLIHIETDRRLGHEWDEWDGKPLARNGDFSAPPGLFFQFGALTLIVGLGATALLLFLLAPRLEALLPALPALLWGALAVVAGGGGPWVAPLLVFFFWGGLVVPGRVVVRGPRLPLLRFSPLLSPVFVGARLAGSA